MLVSYLEKSRLKGVRSIIPYAIALTDLRPLPDPECGRDSIVVDNTVEKTSERDSS